MADDRAPTLPRHLEVAGDRRVTLRRLVPPDVDGLMGLYRSLSPADLRQRFFSEGPPPRRTVERYAQRLTEAGFGVVAVSGAGTIVGEAGYARGTGIGEFGIAVDAAWRGGLGTALLGGVVEHAAAAGVPVLAADVLSGNDAMMALARRRGYALVYQEDWTTLRIIIGTGTAVPPWPVGTSRPRLLVETPGMAWRAAREAAAAGFQVVTCGGPSSGRIGRCPVLEGRPCPLVEGADAIVVALAGDDPHRGALAPIHRFCHPHAPVLVQGSPGEGRPPWLPTGVPLLPAGASPAEIVARLRATCSDTS